MNLQEKLERTKDYLRSIATHDDETPENVDNTLAAVVDFINGEGAELQNGRAERIAKRQAVQDEKLKRKAEAEKIKAG